MKAPTPDRVEGALEPVRAELLRAARAEAADLLARADRDATALLERARAEARALLEDAHREGEAQGAAAGRVIRARARRTARARELTARREAYEELSRRVTAHVRELRHTADYPLLLERLARHARRLLGPDAETTVCSGGGLVAHAAGRRVDCTLDALAARALDRLGAEVEGLWAP